MSVHFYSDDEENDNLNDTSSNVKVTGRDSVIFAVECCKEMFEVKDGSNPFTQIINAVHDMILNKIITNDKDLHGVLFFGTTKNNLDFPGIYEWQQFDVPSVKSIIDLRNMVECDEVKFKHDLGIQKGYQISDVLWACLNMFSGTTYSLASKTLLFFPWNSDPHPGDDNARRRAKAKATDLHDHGVDVQVVSFNKDFSYDNLYKEILSDSENPEPIYDNPIDCIENLYSYLLRKCTKQRPLSRVLLRLGKDVDLSVGVYTVTRRAQKSSYVTIDTTTNEEVTRKNMLLDGSTGEILMPSDVKLFQKWGGRNLVFEKEEVSRMRRIIKQGLNLIGFKPRSQAIKPWYHVRNSQFIYPDDTNVQGSSTLFCALLQRCLERDVVAICSYALRESSPPRCVALLPQDEVIDQKSSQQISPPGFFVIFLPFADDIRKLDIPRDYPEPSTAQIEAAGAMMKKLQMKFDPENFDNPALQTHYKNLEAMALDKPERDPIEDHTEPNTEMIEKLAGSQINHFKEVCGLDEASGKKRGAGADGEDRAAKKTKESMQVDVKEYIAQNKLAKLTVQGLKEICRSYGLKSSGKKADLIRAIEEHF